MSMGTAASTAPGKLVSSGTAASLSSRQWSSRGLGHNFHQSNIVLLPATASFFRRGRSDGRGRGDDRRNHDQPLPKKKRIVETCVVLCPRRRRRRRRSTMSCVAMAATGKPQYRTERATADGPGQYGGPPLDMKVRKMWGGVDKDPIKDSSEYIWNVDWRRSLDAEGVRREEEERDRKESERKKLAEKGLLRKEEESSGFLSLGRSMMLDRMDVDLSKELSKPVAKTSEISRRSKKREGGKARPRWRYVPTRAEQDKWAKGVKAASRGGGSVAQDAKKSRLDAAESAKRELERYNKLKNDLLLLTLALGGVGATTAYATYSAEVAVSYGVGFVGSVVYLRMLSSSVDSIGSTDVGGAARGAAGQPRLLVPLILVMTFNRWNALLAPQAGFELQLLPMLVGFFTYKAATIVQTFKELLPQQPETKTPPTVQ